MAKFRDSAADAATVIEADARARIANQIDREKRLAIADVVVDNSGNLDALEQQVDDVWRWATALPPAGPDAGRPVPREDGAGEHTRDAR